MPSSPGVIPCFSLLVKLTINFMPSEGHREELYIFIKQVVNNNSIMTREILSWFPKLMPLFTKWLIEDYDYWHRHYLKNCENSSSAPNDHQDVEAIAEFYRYLCKIDPTDSPAMNECFTTYLTACLYSRECYSLKDLDSEFLILWSKRLPQFASKACIEVFMEALMHYIFTEFLASGAVTKLNHSSCIRSVCTLIGRNQSTFIQHKKIVMNMLNCLADSFRDGRDDIIKSLCTSILNLPLAENNLLEEFVYMTLVKHCSKKWLIHDCSHTPCVCSLNFVFWQKLLDEKTYRGRFVPDGLIAESNEEIHCAITSIWNCIWKSVFDLSSVLNFKLTENNSLPVSEKHFSPVASGDITLFSNLTSLIESLSSNMPLSVSQFWKDRVLRESVQLSMDHPFISAFNRLVVVALNLQSTADSSWSDLPNPPPAYLKFIPMCLKRCQVYTGDLHYSNINVILHTPGKVIASFEPDLPEFLQVAHHCAMFDTKLAIRFVRALSQWSQSSENERFASIISQMIPSLASLPKLQLGYRSKMPHFKENRALIHEIYTLLAKVDRDTLKRFYSSFRPDCGPRGNLNLKFSSQDLHFDINLVHILPQAVLLASQSPFPAVRLHSVELIHFISCYIVGKSFQLEDMDTDSFALNFRKIIVTLCELSINPVLEIRKISRSLLIQFANLFSAKLVMKELNKSFIDALTDFIVLSKNHDGLQLCSDCFGILVTVGQDTDDLVRQNIEMIINHVFHNLLHPSLPFRKGACLILLAIHEAILNQLWCYDKYCLYVIYLAISNLTIYPEGREYVGEILKNFRTAIVLNPQVLLKKSSARLSPPELVDADLKDMFLWLQLQAVTTHPLVTKECIAILGSLTDSVPDFHPTRCPVTDITAASLQIFAKISPEIDDTYLAEILISGKLTCPLLFFKWLLGYHAPSFLTYQGEIFFHVIGKVSRKMAVSGAKEIVSSVADQHQDTAYHEEFISTLFDILILVKNLDIFLYEKMADHLVNQCNFHGLVSKYLTEPFSFFGVRHGTKQYEETCVRVWSTFKSQANVVNSVCSSLFQKMSDLFAELPNVIHSGRSISDKLIEHLIFCCLLKDQNFTFMKFQSVMKKWLFTFCQAFKCCTTCNHAGTYPNRRDMAKLLQFILSCASFEKVCSELFNCFESLGETAMTVYFRFEHILQPYILDGIEDHHTCIGNMDSSNKITILCRLLSKCFSSPSSKLAHCVMKSLISQWPSVNEWVKANEVNSHLFLDFLYILGSSFPSPFGIFHDTVIGQHITALKEDRVSYKFQLLAPYTDSSLQETLLEESSHNEWKMGQHLQIVLAYSLICGNISVVPHCLKELSNNTKAFLTACDLIAPRISCINSLSQESLLQCVFRIAMDSCAAEISTVCNAFLKLFDEVILPTQMQFYSNNIQNIRDTFFLNNIGADVVQLARFSLTFQLVLKICGVYGRNGFEEEGFVTTSLGTRLEITQRCYSFQKAQPISDTSEEHQQLWRRIQCYALNCLLVLLCHGDLKNKLLQHFIFQNKRDESPCVFERITNLSALHFSTWHEIHQLKSRRKKFIITGIKLISKPSGFYPHSSHLNITSPSVTQECKVYDFIGNLEVPALDDLSCVTEVDLDGDSLDCHECLPYLCNAIFKTVEVGITPKSVGQEMPEWMKSFNVLSRNPMLSPAARSFIAKVVYKCREVFQPFASSWIDPLLLAVSTECCGNGTSYFFYQMVQLLISWQEYSCSGSDSLQKHWNKLVTTILSSAMKCDLTNGHRLLKLLKSILDGKSGRLTPPSHLLIQFVSSQSVAIINLALEASIIFFNHSIYPFPNEDRTKVIELLKKYLASSATCVTAARAMGGLLQEASGELRKQYLAVVHEELKHKQKESLVSLLKNISEFFPQISERFIDTVLSYLENKKLKTLHRDCVTIISSYATQFASRSLFENLQRRGFFSSLTSTTMASSVKNSIPEIIKCFVNCEDSDMHHFILNFVEKNVGVLSYSTRACAYEIFVSTLVSLRTSDPSNSYQLAASQKWFIRRLFAEPFDIREKMISCLVKDDTFAEGTQKMLFTLLNCASSSDSFDAAYCIVAILLKRFLNFHRPGDAVFDGPMAGGDSNDDTQSILSQALYKISSSAPLFVETIEYEVPSIPEFEDTPSVFDDSKNNSSSKKNWKSAAPSLGKMELIRNYTFGKFPNIQMPYQEIVNLLIWLCQTNNFMANQIFSSLFGSVFGGGLENDSLEYFKKLIPSYLDTLLKKPRMNGCLLQNCLAICWKNSSISLNPVVLYDVCQIYNLAEIGILLSECELQSSAISKWTQPAGSSFSHHHSQHYYSLNMFYESLGYSQVSERVLQLLPDEIRAFEGTTSPAKYIVKSDHLQDIYWANKGLKEMSLLGKWDQLENRFNEWNFSIRGSVLEHRWWRRHLQMQLLSEVNNTTCGRDKIENQLCPEWLSNDKNLKHGVVKREFTEDFDVLFLAHNLVDIFKRRANVSLNDWTSYLALEGKLNRAPFETKTKKLLDNYVMATALDEEDWKSISTLLKSKLPSFSEDLIQWHQLLLNREYYQRYLEQKDCLDEENGYKIALQSAKSEFLKYLITHQKMFIPEIGSLELMKESYNLTEMEIFTTHMNEFNRAGGATKYCHFWKAWDLLADGIYQKNLSDPALLTSMSALCSRLIHLMKVATDFDCSELQGRLRKISSIEESSSLSDNIIRCGHNFILKASDSVEIGNRSSALIKIAEYCSEHVNTSSDALRKELEKSTVDCIMSTLVLGSSKGIPLLLNVFDLILRNESLVELFQSMCLKIDLSCCVFWLPQLVAYLTSTNAVALEPLFDNLATKYPQMLLLLLNLNKNHLKSSQIAQRLMNRLNSQSACQKFVEALGAVCHPNCLLKSLLGRLLKACSEEAISSAYQEIKEKCFYNPHRGYMVGRLYSINNKYEDSVEHIYGMKKKGHQFSKDEIDAHLDKIVKEKLPENIQLESLSPFLSMFDCRVFKFELTCASCHNDFSLRNSTSLITFSPQVTVIQSMRLPMKIRMLGSDGRSYPWIVKYGDDLRQDQYIQQLLNIINNSLKKNSNWADETIATYKVVPLTPHLGMIEVLNSTATLSKLLNASSKDAARLRASLAQQHKNWANQSVENYTKRMEGTSAFAHAAAFYKKEDVIQNFSSKSCGIPQDLLRSVIMNHSESPAEFFYKRLNFMRSHAVMSIAHWLLGVGDRHLNNFLLSTSSCEIIGIDFGLSFGAATEILPVPDLVPFRLTPQICNIYSFIYKKGILQDTMVKCIVSIDSKLFLLALKALEKLPPDELYKEYYKVDSKDAVERHTNWITKVVKRKLEWVNPVTVIEQHLKYASLSLQAQRAYVAVLQTLPLHPEIMTPDELVNMLVSMASDPGLLGLAHYVYESWI